MLYQPLYWDRNDEQSAGEDPFFALPVFSDVNVLHSREAYEDSDVPGEQRHFLRLWLSARHFAGVEDIVRSGIPERR